MTPDQLLLTPQVQARLGSALANAGQADGLQVCIDEAAAKVERYIRGYTVDDAQVTTWTRSLALCAAYTIAGIGTPKDIEREAETTMRELEAYRDGKFAGQVNTASPARSPGAEVTTAADLDSSLR